MELIILKIKIIWEQSILSIKELIHQQKIKQNQQNNKIKKGDLVIYKSYKKEFYFYRKSSIYCIVLFEYFDKKKKKSLYSIYLNNKIYFAEEFELEKLDNKEDQ